MKRPIVVVTIGYIIGILEGLYLHISIVPFYILILAFLYIVKKLYIHKKKRPIVWNYFRYIRYIKLYIKKSTIILLLVSSIIANSIMLYEEIQFKNTQEQLQIHKDIEIAGMIASNAKERDYDIEYKLKTHQGKYFLIHLKKSENTLIYGQQLKVSGEFQMPETKRNESGFDYREYLKIQKNLGIIKVKNIDEVKKNHGIIDIVEIKANQISNLIKGKIKNVLDEKTASILIALLLGDTDFISDDVMESFREANMAHVLAISGMHISYLIFIISRVSAQIMGKRKSYYFTIFMLILYMFITGFSPSVVRATIMGIYILFSKLLHKNKDIPTSIACSALIILLSNPYSILDIGFQLSFAGVLGIELLNNKLEDKKHSQILSIFFTQILILPISIYHFNIFSTYFIFTNLIISIIIGPIMIVSFCFIIMLLFSSKLAIIFSSIPTVFIKMLLLVSQISKLPLAIIYVATPRIWQIVAYFLILLIISIIYQVYFSKNDTTVKKHFRKIVNMYKFYFKYRNPKKTKNIIRILGIGTVCISICFFVYSRDLQIHFVDVGQGDCTFIKTPQGKTILIDGGESTILPYILDQGHTKVDFAIISHFDSDHVNGILDIMSKLKIGEIIIGEQGEISQNYQEFLRIAKEKKIRVEVVKKGDRITIENDVYFDVLWPSTNLIQDNVLNNNALVVKLNFKDKSMLFTGDIEEIAEKQITQAYQSTNVLSSTILKVRTSWLKNFVKRGVFK